MNQNEYNQINAGAFDNYDPDYFDEVQSDLYDPDFATGAPAPQQAATKMQAARPGQKMQLNITITNSTAVALTVELFSALDSVTTRRKPELATGNYAMYPATSQDGIERLIAGTDGTVGFNSDGDLEIRGAAADPKCLVGCGEYPYVSLFESSKVLPFKVAYLRYTVDTDAQIDNQLTHFQRTFAGGERTNVISPRAYFKPNQFQSKTIDILAPFTIDGEKGLRLSVNAGESLRFAFFIQRWARNTA
jgi:hypothetical protein